MVEKTTHSLAFVLLIVFATGGGLKLVTTGAMEATSAVENITVSDKNPIGRVDVIALPSGNAFVSWVERTPGGAEVRARIVRPDGTKAPAIVVAQTSSGVPRMKLSGDEVVIAWTDSRNARKARTAILRMTGD